MVLYVYIYGKRNTQRDKEKKRSCTFGLPHLRGRETETERIFHEHNIYIYSLIVWLPSWCWLDYSFATGWLCQDQRGQGSICHCTRFSTGSEGPGLCQWCCQSSHRHRQQAGEVGHHTEWEEVWVSVCTVFDGIAWWCSGICDEGWLMKKSFGHNQNLKCARTWANSKDAEKMFTPRPLAKGHRIPGVGSKR